MYENSASEQLEEGEIVDDDDFEDISDNSIIDSAFGKFVSSNEHLRALSLSSDSEIEKNKQIRHKRKLLHRKCKIKQKKRKRIRVPSESSDSDIIPPSPELKGKLKEAIRISDIEGGHKNTLETRLKAMGGLVIGSESVAQPDPETHIDDNSDKIDDAELENLRMEALKTAVLNKCQRRKRKKALMEAPVTAEPLKTQENKENDTPKDKDNGEKVVNEINNVNDIEEDEDVLRASLLAGLAKKIAKKQTPNEVLVQAKQVAPKLPTPVVPALPKRPITKFKMNTLNKQIVNKQVINKQIVNNKMIAKINRPKPLVKPLIINVNDDSDSDEELKPKPIVKAPPSKITDLKTIASNVEKFLKEQRAKFETETQKKVLPKDKAILEKSAVKLLPKSQQIEYQQLLKRLRNAERKKKAKKLAENNKVQIAIETPQSNEIRVKIPVASNVVVHQESKVEVVKEDKKIEDTAKSDCSSIGSLLKSKSSDEASEGRKAGIITELTTLQKTLKEIKMQRNGSLQIKSKYQVLTPIIRKITSTSNDRKKQEHRIKTLLQELSEAKDKLTKSHERFSTLVKELVTKKEKIDKSAQENGKIVKIVNKPNKNIDNNKRDLKFLPVTSTPIRANIETEDAAISTIIATNSSVNDCEDMDVCNSDETDICQIDIVDPNDIDQIFKRRSNVKSTIPEYVSPLNFNCYERFRNVDPLGIMCPYEVNGSCRDIECTYKHYLKNFERP